MAFGISLFKSSSSGGVPTPTSRNVLILGRVAVGKSTLANHIAGQEIFPVRCSMESISRPASKEIKRATVRHEWLENYNIYIMDTVEQYEKKHRFDLLSKLDVCDVNVILFVVQKGPTVKEELQQISKFIKSSKHISNISVLVITFCETLNESARNDLVQDYMMDPSTNCVSNLLRKGIFSVGFPNVKEMDDTISGIYSKMISKDEEKLRRLINDECTVSYKFK